MNWMSPAWKRRALVPFWSGLFGIASAFAAGFAPLSFQDPFPPAATPGLPAQPAGTVELSSTLAQALPFSVPASDLVRSGLTAITIEWAMKQKTAVPSGNPLGTLVEGPGFKIVGDWQYGTYGSIFPRFTAANNGIFVSERPLARIGLKAPDSQWHYYTVTYDLRRVTIYVDGELDSQVWLDNFADRMGPMWDASNVPLGNVISIGAPLSPGGFTWNGTPAKNLRISSVALTPAEVRRNFENQRVYAQTLFASPTGLAGNPGTEAQPLSLAAALAQAGPAKKITLLPGTYNGANFQVNTGGTNPLDHCLITGAEGSAPAILQTSAAGATPTVQGAGHVVLRNLTFAIDGATILQVNSAPNLVTIDACRFAGPQDGLIATASPVLVQNCVFAVNQTAVNLVNSTGSTIRNNTIIDGDVGVQYDGNSASARLMNNVFSGQGGAGVVFNGTSHKYFRGDGNVYAPANNAPMALLLNTGYPTSALSTYRKKWYDLDDADSDDPRSRRVGYSAESRSFPLTPNFLDPAAGDYRLAPVAGNAIDAGLALLFQDGTAAPLYDATGAARPQGNGVDIGAFEAAGPFQHAFIFTNDVTTSAGIYQTNGTLIKTLWSGRRLPAGVNTAYWNGLSDDNTAVAPGEFLIKLIAHNVKYVWEGTIGNSSASSSGPSVHANFLPIQSMGINGNNIFYVAGYNEGKNEAGRMLTSDPQTITKRFGPITDIFSDPAKAVATDGTWIYTANSKQIDAYLVSSSAHVNFTGGQSSLEIGIASGSGTSRRGDLRSVAVQAGGNRLFVSHFSDFQVYMLDKRSGQALGSIVVTEPRSIAVTPTGDLWVACKVGGQHAVVRYNNFGAGGQVAATITGLQNPLALAVSPVDGTLLVADGGTSQQVKAFDANGAPLWTFGQPGGYANGPDVTNDKFGFYYLYGSAIPHSLLACQSDGSFWVADSATGRVLHFTAQRQFIDRIMYIPHSYIGSVDANNPARVFNTWMEFNVDHAQPLAQGWTLTKFFGHNLLSTVYGTINEGVYSAATLSNGRTYALVADGYVGGRWRVVEVTPTGLRFTPTTQLDNATVLEPDGSLVGTVYSGGLARFNRRVLTGFDGSNNPQWAVATSVATAPAGGTWMNYDPAGRRFHVTNGLVIVFDEWRDRNGWHLGAVKAGGSQWLWRASPTAGGLDGLGRFDSWCEYGGGLHMVSGRSIFFNFHGEFFLDQGQANQFMHFYDNGLFVGQFGQPFFVTTGISAPGSAGNSFTPSLTLANGQLFLYHNDESSRGSHRWRAEGWDAIEEFIAPITLDNVLQAFITTTDATASESGATGNFAIARTGSTADDLTVNLLISGTASNGVDYVPISNSVTIPAGETTANILITPIADASVEGAETVVLTIASGTNYTISLPNSATVTIQDAAVPTVNLAATVPTASETGPTPGTFLITRTFADTAVTVHYTITGTATKGTDYQTISNSVTMDVGFLSATITITPIDDATIEGSETVVLTLTASPEYNLGAAKSATVTILDNDAPTVNITATTPTIAENSTNSAVFTLTRSSIAGGALTVYFTIGGNAVNGVDYQAVSNSATFAAGFSSTTIRIRPIDDLFSEPTQAVTVTLSNGPLYQIGPNASATVSIIDNEPPTVAPTDLQALVIPGSATQILLYWSFTGINATGLKIERSRDGTNFFPIATVNPADVTFLSSRLNPQTTYFYRINAVNGLNESPYSNTASETTGAATLSPFVLNVNFQPASAVVPLAYESDDGIVYGNRGNGYTYGWTQEATANGVDRDSVNSPEPRYYTFNQMQLGGGFTWELAVPVGIYDVSGVMGDPDAFDSHYHLLVEGVTALNEAPTDGGRWLGWTMRVPVVDGKLTIANGPSAVNNKINFLTVVDTGLSPLQIMRPEMAGTNGVNLQFRFDIATQPGVTYVVQASTNLTNWAAISTNSAVSNLLHFADLKATNYQQRFYRVIVP